MDVRVQLADGDSTDTAALWHWLSAERELRGRVSQVPSPIRETDLGSVTDLLTVAVGTGGAGTVLAGSLITWIRSRRTAAKITIEASGKRVTLDIATAQDIYPLLQQLLEHGIDEP
ncbi:hypothetical protein [Streptomyces sp. UNOC14_S4]|uniref:effector-associated constant component EACC1 n=1 Tax=Streptomyces sp. UNOC14_S4 TaxID=2872340 RepID=UPI001E497D7F|nr:hypothetical protein [Streptomyces sp. UNOC14_S4]MCC3767597.1 hypothetical protein [Streptomyces sp. UNOC14_S4]